VSNTYHNALEEIASTLGRRGQTIYGRTRIVELCAQSGVSLLEESEMGEDAGNSVESLESFLSEYVNLGPAARLTVMILAKQNGIDLTDVALSKKKKSLRKRLRQ
jgi:hypothetical protein